MSDEPGHKAMLYFLEVLMNSAGPLTISQLAGRFGSANFTPEMRTSAGGNESGLKQFLLKYPSLFTIRGNMVSLYDGKDEEETGQDNGSSSAAARRSLPDVSVEMEAVQFFQNQLLKREEKWVPVKSLAGHLSQTTPEIRNIVGPQLEFKKWLLRHMHIFEVLGDLVALREGLAPAPTPTTQRRITFDLPNDDIAPSSAVVPPKTPPAQRRGLPQKTASSLHRSHSFSDRSQLSSSNPISHLNPSPSTPGLKRHNSPVTMTANEYKAVMYVKDVLEKKGSMKLQTLLSCLTQASENIRGTAGMTKTDLEEFLKRNCGIFTILDEDTVDLIKNAKLSVIITGSKPPASSTTGRSSNTGKGKIFHVAKLWGIIDLGEHEHVFFDRSIMQKPMDDLQKHFQIGEVLCFNAILAHKTSRAKWKATHVWKENEQEPSSSSSSLADDSEQSGGAGKMGLSHSVSIEDEINEFLPKPDYDGISDPVAVFNDAELSGAGVIPIWNFKQDEEKNRRATVSIVPESYQMSASALNDLRFVPDFSASFLYGGMSVGGDGMHNGQSSKGDARTNPGTASAATATKPKKFATVACQTVSTNDIIATQLYQDA